MINKINTLRLISHTEKSITDLNNNYIYCREYIITSKAIFILKTTVVTERGSANKMTGKHKMKKRTGNKMKALIEKGVAGNCSSNDSGTDVDIIFDENKVTIVLKK